MGNNGFYGLSKIVSEEILFPNMIARWNPNKESYNDGDSVGLLHDFSGNGNVLSQFIGASKPIFHKSINYFSSSYVTFDGINDEMFSNLFMGANEKFSIFLVAKTATNTTGTHRAISGTANAFVGPYGAGTAYWAAYNGNAQANGIQVEADKIAVTAISVSDRYFDFSSDNKIVTTIYAPSTGFDFIKVGSGTQYVEWCEFSLIDIIICGQYMPVGKMRDGVEYLKTLYGVI